MNEKFIAKSILEDLNEHTKYSTFVALSLKPEDDAMFENYNLKELKREANSLGFNIFDIKEFKKSTFKDEAGETLIATFYDFNDL